MLYYKKHQHEVYLFELPVLAHYAYLPAELPVYYYANMDGYPGCEAQVEIERIEFRGINLLSVLKGDELLTIIEQIKEYHL